MRAIKAGNWTYLLESQAGDLRVEEDDEHPTNTADSSIEAERSTGRQGLHHAEERGRDDNVGAPV